MILRFVLALVVLLAVVCVVFVARAYRADLRRARARIGGHGARVVATRCGPLEYAAAGSGPPVLAVHGAGGGFDQGLLFSKGLISNGYRVIAVSRFGYLGTPLPEDASPAAQADAHACLLDALDLDRVVVLGASAGAPSSLQLAIRHPDRVAGLILLVPAIYMPGADGAGVDVPRGLETLANTVLATDFPLWAASRTARNSLVRTLLATPPRLLDDAGASDRELVSAMLDSMLPVTARRAGMLNDGAVLMKLERYELERVRAPTLVISAADDLYGTLERSRYTADGIAGGRFIGFPDGGHMLVGRQDETTAAMVEFLRAID